jgi:hypothetical protein
LQTTKWFGCRHYSNDHSGALGEAEIRAGACDPRPGGRMQTTMSNDTTAGHKSRHDAMATIVRADRAYHDVAQLHLHEFGGGRR